MTTTHRVSSTCVTLAHIRARRSEAPLFVSASSPLSGFDFHFSLPSAPFSAPLCLCGEVSPSRRIFRPLSRLIHRVSSTCVTLLLPHISSSRPSTLPTALLRQRNRVSASSPLSGFDFHFSLPSAPFSAPLCLRGEDSPSRRIFRPLSRLIRHSPPPPSRNPFPFCMAARVHYSVAKEKSH
jgi:hypothetical protein